jgi:hypothetical protein
LRGHNFCSESPRVAIVFGERCDLKISRRPLLLYSCAHSTRCDHKYISLSVASQPAISKSHNTFLSYRPRARAHTISRLFMFSPATFYSLYLLRPERVCQLDKNLCGFFVSLGATRRADVGAADGSYGRSESQIKWHAAVTKDPSRQ